MGFFKDFKEDLSQAVNELLPDEVLEETTVVNTLNEDMNDADVTVEHQTVENQTGENIIVNDKEEEAMLNALLAEEENKTKEEIMPEVKMSETVKEITQPANYDETEVTIITKGTVINGNMHSDGSLEVMGTINGDLSCQGKLSVIGAVIGNCTAGEVYVGSKKLIGNINCTNGVKIGLGTVILGDIKASEGTIAGAVKGDIDVNGHIIIDSSAIIKGNITAQSIQINNGAVIEGFCSLSQTSVDIDNIFE